MKIVFVHNQSKKLYYVVNKDLELHVSVWDTRRDAEQAIQLHREVDMAYGVSELTAKKDRYYIKAVED